MENISLKLEKDFLRVIEKIMKKHNYMTKTEFIREAIRDKIKKLEEKGTGKTRQSLRPSVDVGSVAELEEKERETGKHAPSHIQVSERKELPSYI